MTSVFCDALHSVSVGVGLEGVGVDDAFVEDESVAFGAWSDLESFGGRIASEKVRVDDVDVASLIVERVGEFFEEILSHDVIIELLLSAHVERESSYFAADFSVLGLVSVVLGASGQ